MNLTVFSAGTNIRILPGTEITGGHRLAIGDGVFVGRDTQIMIAADRAAPGPMIVLGRGTSINRRNLIAAVNEIVFGEFVLTAPNCYFADASHEFRQVGLPITMQGLMPSDGRLEIASHAWIGMNAALVGNVRVGVGTVVGSNAVVNRSIPDYCVAVGQPARVVRAYDCAVREWVRVEDDEHLAQIVARREPIPFATVVPPPAVPIYAGPTVTVS